MNGYRHRRGSIFWALTLIAVGGIFLWQNFNPSIHPWQIIAKFWPIMIIFWGLSKLVDYLQAQAHPETTPPPLFSASEVVLLVLILALGTLVSEAVLRRGQHWPGINFDDENFAALFLNSYTYTQTLSKAVQPQPHLLLVDRHGDVEVHASDQSTIDAVVKKTVRAPNEGDAHKLSDQLKVDVAEQAGRYLLQTNLDDLPSSGRNLRLDYTLRVPKGSSVEVTTERGDLVLDGLKGEQVLTVRHGDAHVSGVEGLVRVKKAGGLTEVRDVKGSMELEGRGNDIEISGITGTVAVNGEFSGGLQFRDIGQTLRFSSSRTDMTAQKLTGRLNMEVGSFDLNGIDGPFELSTRQKDVTLSDFKHSVKIVDNNGNVELRTGVPPTHPIDVDLKRGEIELQLPASSNFQIDASSPHGAVECDFAGPALKVIKEGETPSITGTYGKGGPLIRLRTEYGAIRILHEGPKPPSPPGAPKPPPKVETRSRHLPPRSHTVVSLPNPAASPARSDLQKRIASALRLEVGTIKCLTRVFTRQDWVCPRIARLDY